MVVGKSNFFGISSENSEGIPRIKDSEYIPKNHFLGLFVGISSDISDGTVLGNIPREKRYRNILTNLGRRNIPRNLCRRNIPRKCIRRDIPRKLSSEYPEGCTSSENREDSPERSSREKGEIAGRRGRSPEEEERNGEEEVFRLYKT
ncbi:hypothetical protein F2Q69_00011689 [Brassica cretica]|uniref:Uncharacterized protein n=1 Tax=Brassica cretica TaxID=69181 RepID=A0A8S9R4C4_BRACR|nr:hypothetical protein F2Q69_00011689 [Brassica cretica]